MGGKGGKSASTGLTPSFKTLRSKDESPDDSNKENIPPGRLTRSAKSTVKRDLFNKSQKEERVTRSKSRQRGSESPLKKTRESVSPLKRSDRKRAASPKKGNDATPAKKDSPGRPRRDASAHAMARIEQCHDVLEVAHRARPRKPPVLELDNAVPDKEPAATARKPRTPARPLKANFSLNPNWREKTPDDSDDDEEQEQRTRGKTRQLAAAAATPERRQTRAQSVGRNEQRKEEEKKEKKVDEESPSKQLEGLTRMTLRTPSKGRVGAASPARGTAHRAAAATDASRSRSPPQLRERTPTRATTAAARGPAKEVTFTPIQKLTIKLDIPRVRLAKDGEEWRSRTGKTPRTEGRPARAVARIVPTKKRDASYEPEDVQMNSSESEEEEESESENESGEEEEEEERPRRGRSGARAGGARSCSRGRGGAAAAAARPKQRGGYRLEMEDDDDRLDLAGAPANLAAALDRLAVYRCPRGTLLCREHECAQIREFVRAAIAPNGISQACYISGVPGTGKTASVMAMVKELASAAKRPPFVFIRVNAMYYTDPKQVFSEILHEYEKQTRPEGENVRRLSGPAARKRLNALFERVDRSRPPVLMLVDELDQLSTKKQELIYDVFNWSAVEAARVSIISIANTLDLPERMLNQRICSRLGMNRIVFQPYTHEEIERIVRAKLGGTEGAEEIIDSKVVEIAARKVAAISGDLRKATDILRAAIEAAIRKGEQTLSFEQVKEAIRDASETLLVLAVRSLDAHQRIIFDAAVEIVRTRDVVDFSVGEYVEKYEAVARLVYSQDPINEPGFQRIVFQLCSLGLVKIVNPNERVFYQRRVRLLPAVHDATSALKIVEDRRKATQSTTVTQK